MNTDSAFVIGKKHEVCQDYSLTEIEDGIAKAWVSDGCSSSLHSDVGARILILSAKRMLYQCYNMDMGSDFNKIGSAIMFKAHQAVYSLLPTESLDATLLSLLSDGKKVFLSSFGDGVFFVQWESGNQTIIDIEYENNYPDYLSYRLDEQRQKKYDEIWIPSFVKIINTKEESTNIVPLVPREGFGLTLDVKKQEDRIVFVASLSDGIKSFYRKTDSGHNEPIPFQDVLKQLLCFKLFSGRFVQRRLNRFLKDVGQQGLEHYDDLSLAVIYFGE